MFCLEVLHKINNQKPEEYLIKQQKFKDHRNGEIVTSFNILDIKNFDAVK